MATAMAAEVLAAHLGIDRLDGVGAEPGGEHAAETAGKRGVVVGGGSRLVLVDGDDRHEVVGDAGGDGFAAADAFDGVDGVAADLVGIRAERELQFHLVRDDVVLGAAVDGADG